MSEIPLLVDEVRGGRAVATVVLAHGSGSAMDSPFMNELASGLSAAFIRVVRFEFPSMHAKRVAGKGGRPDSTPVMMETWHAVIAQVGHAADLVIGGKSMGGRMASMVADSAGVKGLVCYGYPFHPAGRPDTLRVAHLEKLQTRTLILQGERDTLGSKAEIAGYVLAPGIRVHYLPDGDHSFSPRKSSGHTSTENMEEAVRQTAAFVGGL